MRYGLLRCYPAGGISGNNCLAECVASSSAEATEKLQPFCMVPLNARGYAKEGEITFVVAEFFGS